MSEPESGQSSELVIRVPADSIAKIEGRAIVEFTMEQIYPYGEHVRMNMEFRLKGMRTKEDRTGRLVLVQEFQLVSAGLVSNFHPADALDMIEGSATTSATPDAEAAAELGVDFRRSSDQWAS